MKYLLIALTLMAGGCEFAGLELQKDVPHSTHVLDPTFNGTAYAYMTARKDTIFSLLIKGITYAGIDKAEFEKPGRTFLLMTNSAILRYDTKGAVDVNSFFGKNKVNGKVGTKWEDYPVQTVKNLLLYHIIEGRYSYDDLSPDNVTVPTLLPSGNNKITLRVVNDRNSQIQINDFFNSVKIVVPVSSNIQPTNGVIHVVGNYVEYGVK